MALGLNRFFRKVIDPGPKEIVVMLEELSTIWLKYNQFFSPQKVEVEIDEQPVQGETPREPVEPAVRRATLFDELIEPYIEVIKQQNALEGIYKIADLLNEHGSCPSIVVTGQEKDSETDEIYSVRDILMKVTLKEHTYRVARIAIKLLSETYKDYENLVPKMLTAALGHDVGKIPALRESGLYSKADHPLISAAKVADIFAGKDIIWLNGAIEAIKDHHRQTNDPFTIILKTADSRAREAEIAEVSRDLEVKAWEEWFNVKDFLGMIKPHINVIQTDNRWKAFSFGGVVYSQPDFLYEMARDLAVKKKVVDMTLMKLTEKELALRKIVSALQKEGVTTSDITEGYYGRFYEVQMEKMKKKMFLTPLRIEAFGVSSEIEKVKEGYLQLIKAVVPSRR